MAETNFNNADEIKKNAEQEQTNLEEAAKDATSAAEAQATAQENNQYHEHTDATMNAAAEAAVQGENVPNGAQVTRPKSCKGNFKAISVGNGVSHSRLYDSIGMEDYTISSDLDKYERDTNAQAAQYERISAVIDCESTRQIEDGETSIVGKPDDATVYSLESEIVEKTVTNDTTKYPLNRYDQRRIGTKYDKAASLIMTTGDFVAGVHDVKKGFAAKDGNTSCRHNSAFILNALDTRGNLLSNEFVVPKTGKFWVKSFNPFMTPEDIANYWTKDTTHYRSNGIENNQGQFRATKVTYKWHDPTKPGLFEVYDLTALLENINVATKEAIEQLTCEKSKMSFGLYEELSNRMMEISNTIPILNSDAPLFPDLHYLKDRCTLWNGELLKTTNATVACHNSPTNYFRFMEGLRASEQVFMFAGLTVRNLTKSILFFKGQTGKNNSDPYFNDYSGFSVRQDRIGHHGDHDRNIKLPNHVPMMRQLTTAASFKRAGQIVYQMRDLKTLVNNFLNLLQEDASLQSLLSKVSIMKETVDQLADVCSYGRVVDEEGMSSNAICKLPGSIDMILDFDPNDLVNPVNSSTSIPANPAETKWYASAGYANVYVDNNISRNDPVKMYVLPAWLDTLLKFMRKREFEELFTNDLSSVSRSYYECANIIKDSKEVDKTTKLAINKQFLLSYMIGYDTAKKTFKRTGSIPVQFDVFAGDLFSDIILRAYQLASDESMNRQNYLNAYMSRYMQQLYKPEFGFDKVIAEFYDFNVYDKLKEFLNNPAYEFDGKISKPSQMQKLYPEARSNFLNVYGNIIGKTTIDRASTHGTNSSSQSLAIIRQPEYYYQNLANLKGLTVYDAAAIANSNQGTNNGPYDVTESTPIVGDYVGGNAINDVFSNPQAGNAGAVKINQTYPTTEIVAANSSNEPYFRFFKHKFMKIGSTLTGNESDPDTVSVFKQTMQVPITNFEANGEFFGVKDDLGAVLYGKDHFLIPNADYLQPAEYIGLYADGTQPEVHTLSNFMIMPVDDIAVYDQDNASLLKKLSITHGIYLHDTEANDILDGNTRRYVFADGEEHADAKIDLTNPPLSNINCPSIAINDPRTRIMIRPSLYGFIREAKYGALQLQNTYNGRMVDKSIHLDANNLPSRESTIEYGLLPEIVGVEYDAESTHQWVGTTVVSDNESLHNALGDSKYFYRQSLFVGNADGSYADDLKAYSIENFNDLGNWANSCAVLESLSNATKSASLVTLPKYLLTYLEDERKRLLDFAHVGKLIDCKISNTKQDVIHMLPDFIFANDYTSRYVFNDYRVFKVGKPPVVLDRRWSVYANTIALLYKQYVQNNI